MKLSRYKELAILSRIDTSFFHYTSKPADNVAGKIILKIGRKIGNAVVRNKIKRRIRHIVRELSQHLPIDCMLYPKKNIISADFSELKKDLTSMIINNFTINI